MGERPADLEQMEDWERLLALVDYASAGETHLAFGAGEWRAHCLRQRPQWTWIEDQLDDICGPGYPLVGLRDGQLVGLLEVDGEAWPGVPDPELEAAAARGGQWMTRRPDGTVESFSDWLARQPPDED